MTTEVKFNFPFIHEGKRVRITAVNPQTKEPVPYAGDYTVGMGDTVPSTFIHDAVAFFIEEVEAPVETTEADPAQPE